MTLCAVLLGSVASASASDSSIRNLIKAYNPKILVAEGHVVSAIGEYKKTRNPAPVVKALDNSISVFRSLKSKISQQSAKSSRVQEGKRKLMKGLQSVIGAYEKLKVAFGERAGSPQAAKETAMKAEAAVKRGRKQLSEGIQLLK
ncbi:MAG TPA: hypothetical protein VKV16_01020 [Solirubrobacteraceae bacterium]|nr:hypothetical protein [Solirubrobacteraceae bacterium]